MTINDSPSMISTIFNLRGFLPGLRLLVGIILLHEIQRKT